MVRAVIASTLVLASSITSSAQSQQGATFRSLYVQDQRDRGVPMADDAVHDLSKEEADKLPSYDWGTEVPDRDKARREQARLLLQKPGLTGEDYYYAAFMFQHGQSADDYLYAHILATEAILHGFTRAVTLTAATLDRYLQVIGQKQVFGTQYTGENYAYYLQHRTEPDVLEKFKSISSQQTLEPYAPQLVSDEIRADFCVASLSLQQQHIADVKGGKAKSGELPGVKRCVYK